jgi:hypothetical protein
MAMFPIAIRQPSALSGAYSDRKDGTMKKLIVLVVTAMAIQAHAMVPLQQTSVAIKTDVKVKSEKDRTRRNEYTNYGYRTAIEKDTKQSAFLSIEVRSMSPRPIEKLRIVYHLYELEFEHATNKTILFTRAIGRGRERFAYAGKGELSIENLKPLEVKVVESEPIESSYRSTQDTTKIISQTRTSGRKFGGYIVEYFSGDELVKRDASSQRLHEAYLQSLKPQQGAAPVQMKVNR